MKKRASDMNGYEVKQTLDLLYTAASSIRGRSDVKAFLRDLLTESERIMLGRRIWIARLLILGQTFEDIAQDLRVSRKTIARVARWLSDQFDGYERAVKGVEKEYDRRAVDKEAQYNPFSYAAVKKKLPLHFLFFPKPRPKKQYRTR